MIDAPPDPDPIPREAPIRHRVRSSLDAGALLVLGASCAWAVVFGWLALTRHLAGGTHAEDLGFTDQVIANFLRGQWFRMSIYDGAAAWNTELDLSRIARPDSLLAFHVEPMLLLFVPLYALGGGASLLLILQAVAVALGAVPAYRLGKHATGSAAAGLAVAACYLLSPLGQWAVLADFHTSTLAAPLLLLAVERLIVARAPFQSLAVAALALSAREDVGPTLALLGADPGVGQSASSNVATHRRGVRRSWARCGRWFACWSCERTADRTRPSQGATPTASAAGLPGVLQALTRPSTLGYAGVLVLSGGWLGLLAPLALLPALPSLAINGLSSSAWMASGQAHYSGLVLPFLVLAAADGLRRVGRRRREASVALVVTAILAYAWQGAGPFGGRYAPAAVTDHASRAIQMASALPADAAVSASSSLVPHLSRRARVFVFPALQDADHVFLDLRASPAPTSAGDVFLRVQSLLGEGGWRVEAAEDGLLLLARDPLGAADRPASDACGRGLRRSAHRRLPGWSTAAAVGAAGAEPGRDARAGRSALDTAHHLARRRTAAAWHTTRILDRARRRDPPARVGHRPPVVASARALDTRRARDRRRARRAAATLRVMAG